MTLHAITSDDGRIFKSSRNQKAGKELEYRFRNHEPITTYRINCLEHCVFTDYVEHILGGKESEVSSDINVTLKEVRTKEHKEKDAAFPSAIFVPGALFTREDIQDMKNGQLWVYEAGDGALIYLQPHFYVPWGCNGNYQYSKRALGKIEEDFRKEHPQLTRTEMYGAGKLKEATYKFLEEAHKWDPFFLRKLEALKAKYSKQD